MSGFTPPPLLSRLFACLASDDGFRDGNAQEFFGDLAGYDWALDQIARRVKAARDADFKTRNADGRLLNHVTTIGTLGGATLDIEENYLMKKLFTAGLGVVSVENQARI